MYKEDGLRADTLTKYRVVCANLIDLVTEGINPLDAKIRALNILSIDWESAPLDNIEAVALSEREPSRLSIAVA